MNENLGTIRIAPGVLATIARLTALSVTGVSRLCAAPVRGVGSLWSGRGPNAGVRVDVVEGAVIIDVYLVARPDASLLPLGREVQARITRAVHDMVGMPVRAVNVFIRDIERSDVEPQGSP